MAIQTNMSELQRQASDPTNSVWVSASAGTGKTKILTDRVLRLLISGAQFQKILCLTFTNAAALEMQGRIKSKLEFFANLENSKLLQELEALLGRKPIDKEVECSKNLYNQLLNSQDSINIYTIHAFCQKMLKLFAFEAGINPEFKILDDISAKQILNQIRNQLYINPVYNELIDFFLTNFHEVTINDIFTEIVQQKIKFKQLFAKGTEYILHDVEATTKLLSDLYFRASLLLTKYEIEFTEDIKFFFLTKDYAKRKSLLSKKMETKYPELLNQLESLQEEIFKLDQLVKLQEMQNYTALVMELARIFLQQYDQYKNEHGLLDYDDLIFYTKLLLADEHTKAWLLYKQSGGVEHLLVDEAQDTSPQQWEIITSIIAEFYTSTKYNGTIFVVGDEKQSIFSFQGANLRSFDAVNSNLSTKLFEAQKNFKNITLEWSYRSTGEILDVVYKMLDQIKRITPHLFTSHNAKILPFRENHKGTVELWPLVKGQEDDDLFWPLPDDHNNSRTSKQLLAQQIANFIKKQLKSLKVLPSTNSLIKESDFMLLVRKRDEFVFELIDCLKKNGLNVEDVDRVVLDQSLSVLDLMSVAKFVLLPLDDLNLACLLKSPIIGLSEEDLQHIALARGRYSIWDYIQNNMSEYSVICSKLEYLLQMHKISNASNFFSMIVDCLDIRKILVEHNGVNSNDLINELIYLSANYGNNVENSLQSFVYWFENNQIDIKRNLDSSNKIRIMTVHASKGLQAPIVILCDTTSVPINSNKFVWDQEGNMLTSTQSTSSPEIFKELKERERQKELQEYIRLLYVAMTRAEDHLVVCGYQHGNTLPQNCWYELVARVIGTSGIDEQVDDADSSYAKVSTVSETSLPWIPNSVLIDNITKVTKQNYSSNSPLLHNNSLEYGRIFHKILEDAVIANNFSLLDKHPMIYKLPVILQDKIHKNIRTMLNNPEFMGLNSQELQSEVTIGVNMEEEVNKTGRIDLLAISQTMITIIDYKSDINPPKNPQLVRASYVDQLNFYRHVIQKLYPQTEIICKILWLENGHFMTI